MTQDFNRLMQVRPFYFDIQINVSPDLQVFLIYANFSKLFLSAILYELSAILQAGRLAFHLYDALITRSTGFFSFLQFNNIQNTADLRLYTKYEL